MSCRGTCARSRPRTSRAACAVALFTSVVWDAGPLMAAQDASICGRAGEVSQLLLALQKPTAERLWRDTKMFVIRDREDGSMWAFSIKNSTVHPAVRCRKAASSGAPASVDVGQICAAGEAACASFARQVDDRFDSLGASGTPR